MSRHRISFTLSGNEDAVRRIVRQWLDKAGFNQVHFAMMPDNPTSRVVDAGDVDWTQPAFGSPFFCSSAGLTFKLTATDQEGFHTGRRRWKVECTGCNTVVHEATTGPEWNILSHVRHHGDD